MPRFDAWIFKIKEYFELYGTPMNRRMCIVCLDGAAYEWYKWLVSNDGAHSWIEFLEAMKIRFGRSAYHNPKVALKKVHQSGTVEEYQSAFESLTNRIVGLSVDTSMCFFIGGLYDQLQNEVLLAQPVTYQQAVAMAKMYEQHQLQALEVQRLSLGRNVYQKSGGVATGSANAANQRGVGVGSKAVNTVAPNTGGITSKSATENIFKRLTTAEIKNKREKGLCYYCDAKYSREHKCKPSFCLLLDQDELQEILQGESDEDDEYVDVNAELSSLEPEISLNAVEGEFHPKTLRVTGFYKKEAIKILIDSGSMYNFIRESVARRLKLEFTPTDEFRVVTRGGQTLTCGNKCNAVGLIVQGIKVVADFFVLNATGCDVVLGV